MKTDCLLRGAKESPLRTISVIVQLSTRVTVITNDQDQWATYLPYCTSITSMFTTMAVV
jgi:hypothetical protein